MSAGIRDPDWPLGPMTVLGAHILDVDRVSRARAGPMVL
jgi:hypothetical protein